MNSSFPSTALSWGSWLIAIVLFRYLTIRLERKLPDSKMTAVEKVILRDGTGPVPWYF